VDIGIIVAFALTALAVELTPGPNMAYLAIVSAARGTRPGLAAVAGVALGLALLGAAVGLGLGPLLMQNPVLYQGLRWAGILYLLWLAWEAWADARRPITADTNASLPPYFRRGLVTNLLNPKAALFYLTVMPGFVVEGVAVAAQTVWLSSIYVAVASLVHAGVVLAAGRVQPLLTAPASRRRLGLVFALLLIAVAGWVLVATGG
jgi:threonine/homoserine/homoserine lactone efflux protein